MEKDAHLPSDVHILFPYLIIWLWTPTMGNYCSTQWTLNYNTLPFWTDRINCWDPSIFMIRHSIPQIFSNHSWLHFLSTINLNKHKYYLQSTSSQSTPFMLHYKVKSSTCNWNLMNFSWCNLVAFCQMLCLVWEKHTCNLILTKNSQTYEMSNIVCICSMSCFHHMIFINRINYSRLEQLR